LLADGGKEDPKSEEAWREGGFRVREKNSTGGKREKGGGGWERGEGKEGEEREREIKWDGVGEVGDGREGI